MKERLFKTLCLAAFTVLFIPVPMNLTSFNVELLWVSVGVISFAAAFIKTPAEQTAQLNGVNVEIWVNYIINKFWKQNKFLQFAFNDDQYVIGGSIVHIPQTGASPEVVKNRTVYPATAVRRTDTDVVFALDVYTTDPNHITDAEKVELSYDKMDSVLGEHINALNEVVANDIIIKWLASLPAGNIIKTSGGAAAGTVPGQTGTRKVMVHGDLRKAQLAFNVTNVPKEDRFALLDANMQDQLFESLSNTQYRDFSAYANAETGVIGKLYDFQILDRSSVAVMTSGDVVSPLGTAVAATDNAASIVWQKNSVTRALGEVKVFDNPNRAEYYGDIISGLLRAGARVRRADFKGVAAIVAGA